MNAAVCLTLALLHFLVWCHRRTSWANLFFALTAVGTAGYGLVELWVIQTSTTGELGRALWHLHFPGTVIVIGLVGFIRLHLGAGRLWLAWGAIGARCLALVINIFSTPNINFRAITGVGHISFLGEPVTYPVGVSNPLMIVSQVGLVLLVAFVLDASITVWRRGNRRALWLSSAVSFFAVTGSMQLMLVFWGVVHMPITVSLFFLGSVIVMGYEMSLENLKVGQLSDEVRRQREELAHFSRVTMLGELSATLAHELNQPLGAILRNAEAAELFLQQRSPDLEEIKTILKDIRLDDLRAGEVIRRMRSLLRRHEIERVRLDLNALVSEVAALVRPDALTRRVLLTVESGPDQSCVLGDRVHLQQVVLNLLLNALDAVKDVAPGEGSVAVRVCHVDRQLEVAVHDNGLGLDPVQFTHLFEPFYTTKPNGMGMGLSISRTIVEAHGGRFHVENNVPAGAIFRFTLPAAPPVE